MDSFEWNKILGAVLGTVLFVLVVRIASEALFEPETSAKPGYVVEGVEQASSGTTSAPVEETLPDFGTVLPAADVKAGEGISVRCQQCHTLTKGGPNQTGPNLWGVEFRPRAEHAGFSYSSAMNASHAAWTYENLFRFLKLPAAYVPGTKMTFAGLRSPEDRVNLLAYLRTLSDSPPAIPAPAPKAAAPAAGAPVEGNKTVPTAADAAKAPSNVPVGTPSTAPTAPKPK